MRITTTTKATISYWKRYGVASGGWEEVTIYNKSIDEVRALIITGNLVINSLFMGSEARLVSYEETTEADLDFEELEKRIVTISKRDKIVLKLNQETDPEKRSMMKALFFCELYGNKPKL